MIPSQNTHKKYKILSTLENDDDESRTILNSILLCSIPEILGNCIKIRRTVSKKTLCRIWEKDARG